MAKLEAHLERIAQAALKANSTDTPSEQPQEGSSEVDDVRWWEVDLLGWEIGAEGAQLLCDWLLSRGGGGAYVEQLYLNRNKLGENGGVRWIAQAIERHPNLKTVVLNSNALGDDGAELIIDALIRRLNGTEGKEVVPLEGLGLCDNGITEEGAVRLAERLCSEVVCWKKGEGELTLSLNHNPIGEKGAKALQRLLKKTMLESGGEASGTPPVRVYLGHDDPKLVGLLDRQSGALLLPAS
ncbi:hypothetical protein QOT17_001629 [Balamuthia mandrillaris]